jgi:hypothetical protein
MRILTTFGLFGLFLLSSCAYRGDASDPFNRKFSYFSMVNGDDIRSVCGPGVERYRLIYNAVYDEHLRIYEIKRGPKDYHSVRTTVSTPANVTDAVTSADILAPWRGKQSLTQLDDVTFEKLVKGFEASGMFEPAPKGLRLPSTGFYWIAVACRNEKIAFQAWPYPSERFANISFAKLLTAIDGNEIAFRPAEAPRFAIRSGRSAEQDFTLHIGDNGLIR